MSKIIIPTAADMDSYGLSQPEIIEPLPMDTVGPPPVNSTQMKAWLAGKGFAVEDEGANGWTTQADGAARAFLKHIGLGSERVDDGSGLWQPIELKSNDWIRAAVRQQMAMESHPHLFVVPEVAP